jgi:monoamine oxidase
VSGYSDIPNRLYEGFTQAGGEGFLQHQLLSFDRDGSGGYVLRFFQRESGTLTTAQAARRCVEDPASCRTYGAKYVILALPKRSIEVLDQQNFLLTDPTVQQLLNSVLDVPAMRFFLAYERPWWTEAETHVVDGTDVPAPTCGRSTTDLRVRQFYYWHTASDGGLSFVLGSYTNGQANFYWRELQNGPGPYDRLPGAAPPLDPPRFDAAQGKGPRAATDDMARFAHRDLVEVVGPLGEGKQPPEPYYAHFQDWDKDPWGAGWHAWTAGHDEVALIPRILQPLPGDNVYVCGESYSNVQGWVQGALNSSEVLLQKKLGLAYPSWLSPGGTWLGPGSEGIPTT